MSVFRLNSAPYEKIDCRYIESADLTITNNGGEEFDVLVELETPHNVIFVGLFHLAPGAVAVAPNLPTNYGSFSLLLVTNLNNHHPTGVTVHVKNHGALVALFTQEDCIRMS
ncbi:hypothetical protein ACFFSY_27160 [Paenibacillus aurantiacus]|uniref:dUTPase-like domain-containing protein n=1 Tax=Paenibacillus aurantiacus TaxID=1936118 RepID=A0ABV5KWN0_9BACL